MDLRKFRKDNGLTQPQLGEYLGIKKSVISSIETGERGLPDKHLARLLANDRGWDTSALNPAPGSVSASAVHGARVSATVTRSAELAALRVENEMLRRQLDDKERIIELLMKLVKD